MYLQSIINRKWLLIPLNPEDEEIKQNAYDINLRSGWYVYYLGIKEVQYYSWEARLAILMWFRGVSSIWKQYFLFYVRLLNMKTKPKERVPSEIPS